MKVEIKATVKVNETGWNHVYGDGHPATLEHAHRAALEGLLAGETPFEMVTVEADRITVDVDAKGWAFVMEGELTEKAVEAYVRGALLFDGTLDLA